MNKGDLHVYSSTCFNEGSGGRKMNFRFKRHTFASIQLFVMIYYAIMDRIWSTCMSRITLQEAQTRLPELAHTLSAGHVVTITENNRPVAQLVAVPANQPRPPRPRPPVTGIPRAGSVPDLAVPDDFKAPLDDLREYME
jgi:antitoxin (DNA-binding transcriptional repressor) of toxin-antitoxin stability system